jgi:hypothetical protein
MIWAMREGLEEIAYCQILSCNSGGRWVKRWKVWRNLLVGKSIMSWGSASRKGDLIWCLLECE